MINHIRELVAIPSVTGVQGPENRPYVEEVHRALMYVLDLCDSMGFRTKNCSDHMGYAEIGSGEEMIGILCHLDVVPEGNGWTYPAFGGEIHDGKLYGRGVVDDKGPAIMSIYAMKEILDSGMELNKRIRILFGCQEETGVWTDMEFYKATEEHPTYGYTPDGDFPVIYGEKGILQLQLSMPYEKTGFIDVEGGVAPNVVADLAKCVLQTTKGKEAHLEVKGKSAHGSMPWDGENAISKLMKKVKEANDSGLTTCAFADFYMDKIGFDLYGESMNAAFEDKESGKISYNAGIIRVQDEEVQLVLDIRYPVTFTVEEVVGRIQEEVKSYGVCAEILENVGSIYLDSEGPVITTLLEAYNEVTKDEMKPLVIGGGTYARLLDNVVAFGPLFPGRECTEHQANECISLEDIEKAKEIYVLALKKLLLMEVK